MKYIAPCSNRGTKKECKCVFCTAVYLKFNERIAYLSDAVLSVENIDLSGAELDALNQANKFFHSWFCWFDCCIEDPYIYCTECQLVDETINKLNKIAIIGRIPLSIDIAKICYDYI
jgi:hypothetical protein